MPAPRLLDKKLVNAALATERKQEIDKGIKLAKAVDALKEAKTKEEADLAEWRVSTLNSIQMEITLRQSENERLRLENQNLKEERLRLESPIDLTQAWKEVRELQRKNESIADNILSQEINVTARENDLAESKSSLEIREKKVISAQDSIEQMLEHAESQRTEAMSVNKVAKDTLTQIESQKSRQEEDLAIREQEIRAREDSILAREETAEREQLIISSEKLLLADRRATLERGFEELRRKQNGLHR